MFPPCPACGEPTMQTTVGALAANLGRAGVPLPLQLRMVLLTSRVDLDVFCCGCGWSGLPLGTASY